MSTSTFDPWSITIEQQVSMDLDDRQVWQCIVARGVTREREAILAGTGYDVMQAVATCAQYELSMPLWLADEFQGRFKAVKNHRAASWDDPQAFGRPYPKGTHLRSLDKEARAGPVIWYMVKKICEQDPTRPIDEHLFEEVAARLRNKPGLGRSECARIYYKVAPEMERLASPKGAGNS